MASPTLLASSLFASPGVPFLTVGEKTTIQRNGIAMRTSIYKSFGYPGGQYIPVPLYTPYPDQSTGGFVCDKTEIEGLDGGFYKMTVTWISLFQGPTSYVTFDAKLVQVPIDQSPDFINIAGTPDAPQNGAVFDANGRFVGFGQIDGDPSPYQGVVSAYVVQALQIVRGSGPFAAVPDPNIFCESIVNTLRGSVWEYELTYNLSINVQTGIAGGNVDS